MFAPIRLFLLFSSRLPRRHRRRHRQEAGDHRLEWTQGGAQSDKEREQIFCQERPVSAASLLLNQVFADSL
jgi:hypothetical protein